MKMASQTLHVCLFSDRNRGGGATQNRTTIGCSLDGGPVLSAYILVLIGAPY